jgi:large subunit ribosomal protein L21
MLNYAIVQASGKQFWIEENRFYDFNKLPLQPGDTFNLTQVLLLNQHGCLKIGKPFLDNVVNIEVSVIRHFLGSKVRVYKMRPKKKTRKTFGSRAKLTRVFVNSISLVNQASPTCYLV